MSAKTASPPKQQKDRVTELITAARDYAQALETFEAASNRHRQARGMTRETASQLADELDDAADAVGRAQARTAELVYALVADGSLEALAKYLATRKFTSQMPDGKGRCN